MTIKNIILFDMDNTLVSADTMDLWGQFLEEKGITTEAEIQQRLAFNQDYQQQKLDMKAYIQFEISLIHKIPVALRHPWREDFFQGWVKPRISQKGLKLIQTYKKNPDNILLLITATIDFIALPVSHYAKMDDFIATEPHIQNGIYTGEISGIPNLGAGKIKKISTMARQQQYFSAPHYFVQ